MTKMEGERLSEYAIFLDDNKLSMSTLFQQSVWNAIDKIPKGKVTTYREIAEYIGSPKAFRAVGTAVGSNPKVPQTPCHRVVPTSGKIGNYSGAGGTATKIKLLKSEGLYLKDGKISELEKNLYTYRKD